MTSDDFWTAQLRARQIEEDTGISLADQAVMPIDEWGRLVHGQTPVQAALQAIGAQQPPAAPQIAPQAPQEQPVGRTLEELALTDDQAFLAWRQNRTSGGEGVGILAGNDRDAWARAAAAKSGRTGWVNTNTIESPRIDRVFTEDRIDSRPARDRFGSPINEFNL